MQHKETVKRTFLILCHTLYFFLCCLGIPQMFIWIQILRVKRQLHQNEFIFVLIELDSPVSVGTEFNSPVILGQVHIVALNIYDLLQYLYIYNMTCTRLFVLLRSFFALNYASALWKLIGCLLAPIWPDHHLTWISVALRSWCHSPLTFVPFILSFSTLPHSYYCLSCFSPYRGSVLPKGYSYMSSKWSALSTLNSIISVKNYQCFHCNLTIPYFSDTMKIKY